MEKVFFIEELCKKIGGIENMRSPYLNARVPKKGGNKVDLVSLSAVDGDFPRKFLGHLLCEKGGKGFEEKISSTPFGVRGKTEPSALEDQRLRAGRRLETLFRETEEGFQERGDHVFGFGYPLLIRKNNKNNKWICAPLFVWRLSIERTGRGYSIKRKEDAQVLFNPVLQLHLQRDMEGAKLKLDFGEERFDEFDGAAYEEVAKEVIRELFHEGSWGAMDEKISSGIIGDFQVEEIPEKEDSGSGALFLCMNGVFAIYKSLKQPIIRDLKALLEMAKGDERQGEVETENRAREAARQTISGKMDTIDPSQEDALRSITECGLVVIQGPPGTGKSETLTGVLTNAMGNKKSCLVVCEKRTAMEVLQQQLGGLGLGDLAVLVDDPVEGRKGLVDKARKILDDSPEWVGEVEGHYRGYEDNVDKYNNLNERINKKHHVAAKEIPKWNGNWKDLVGKYLRTKVGNEDYVKKFKRQFKLHTAFPDEYKGKTEFDLTCREISDAQALYNKEYEESVLENLAIDYSEVYSFGEAEKVKNKIDDLREGALKVAEKIERAEQAVEDKMAVLSEKKEHCERLLGKVRQHLRGLWGFFRNLYAFFRFPTDLTEGAVRLACAKEKTRWTSLGGFRRRLVRCERDVEVKMSMLREGDFVCVSEKIPAVGKALEVARASFLRLREQKEWEVLQYSFPKKVKTLQELIKSTRDCKEKIEAILDKWVGYKKFYEWQHVREKAGKLANRAISLLIEYAVPSKEWLELFEHLYYGELLKYYELERRPFHENSKFLSEQEEMVEKLCKEHIAVIKSEVRQLQQQIVGERAEQVVGERAEQIVESKIKIGRNLKSLYNKRGSKGVRRNSLRKIFKNKDGFDFFKRCFPVVMMNPTTVSSVFPLREGLFDVVIFDEASQLRIEDTYPSFFRGKKKVISGDSQQMPPSNYFAGSFSDGGEEDSEEYHEEEISREEAHAESLLDYAQKVRDKEVLLKFHYRSKHPDLIQFSNAAFYESKLQPMPARRQYVPITFIEVGGEYADGKNPQEARCVLEEIRKLGEKAKEEGRSIGSIGVATFNQKQRDLIRNEIEKRRRTDPDFDKLLKELEGHKEKFFVKNLVHIQGDERDIILLSTTFGRTKEGNFSQRFGPIGNEHGDKLLNVLITRAKEKVVVCTSVPSEYYSRCWDKIQENRGSGLFYAYLAYAKAVYNEQEDEKKRIIELLNGSENGGGMEAEPSVNISGGLTESPFEEEVLEMIEKRYSDNYGGKINIDLQYKVGGFRVDMMLLSAGGEPLAAIECDGAAYHSSDRAYLQDRYRERQIKGALPGLVFYRIYSTNWWRETEEEIKKLIDFLHERISGTPL